MEVPRTADVAAAVRAKVDAAVDRWLARAPLAQSTLILDGTGPNGALQLALLRTVGQERLDQLGAVHVLSGSFFAYVSMFALSRNRGELKWGQGGMDEALTSLIDGWDDTIRAAHRRSLGTVFRGLFLAWLTRKPLYGQGTLSSILDRLVSPEFARLRIEDLPPNVTFWLYDRKNRQVTPVGRETPYAKTTLHEMADCVGAVPRIYEPGRIGDQEFIDPVYSPGYRRLVATLLKGPNCLFSNVLKDDLSHKSAIFLKPHVHRNGRRMMLGDFIRLLLDVENPRSRDAHRAAVRTSKRS